jgi:predicted oxidoreductase
VSDIQSDMADLAVDYVDLILLHGPSHRGAGECDQGVCDADAGQWRAYEEMYKSGKAKAIGVSNYCQSCFECLLNKANVTPAVNQSECDHTRVPFSFVTSGLVLYAPSPPACVCLLPASGPARICVAYAGRLCWHS